MRLPGSHCWGYSNDEVRQGPCFYGGNDPVKEVEKNAGKQIIPEVNRVQ